MRGRLGRDLNIRSHDAGVVPTGLSQTLLCGEPLLAAFITRRIRDIESTLDQAALQIPNVRPFVGQRHAPEHGPTTTSPTCS